MAFSRVEEWKGRVDRRIIRLHGYSVAQVEHSCKIPLYFKTFATEILNKLENNISIANVLNFGMQLVRTCSVSFVHTVALSKYLCYSYTLT
jgi:hypothetical protein